MRYHICYRLKRKNARRKKDCSFWSPNNDSAKATFNNVVEKHKDADQKQYELVTGDWKHIIFYGEE